MSSAGSDDLAEFIESEIRRASDDRDPIKALQAVIQKFFPKLTVELREDAVHMRLSSTWFSVRVVVYDDFQSFENNNPNGGSLAGVSSGKKCDARTLLADLTPFAKREV